MMQFFPNYTIVSRLTKEQISLFLSLYMLHTDGLHQEPLKPRPNVSCRFLENQLAISFKFFDILYR
jgi:hypothetical protein